MTRISVGVKPKELCDKHLNRERIEILRIPNQIKSGKLKPTHIPKEFKLGTGHVKFFTNKLKYLHDRYNELTLESLNRGFNPTDFSDSFKGLPPELYNDYVEQPKDREIIKHRINERLKTMKNIRYRGESMGRFKIK